MLQRTVLSKKDNLPVLPRNPVKHFRSHACNRCSWKPCEQFRFGVTEGTLDFVHHTEGGGGDCPFNVESAGELRSALLTSSFNHLVFKVQRVIGQLTPAERTHVNPENYFTSFEDSSRRVDFLVWLWELGYINILYLPFNYHMIPKLRAWIRGGKPGEDLESRRKRAAPPQWLVDRLGAQEQKVLTDELEDGPDEQLPLKITSIKWRHKDETLRKENPDTAHDGDTVELTAEFENYVEGAGVDFFVLGNVNGKQKQLSKIHTRCKNMGGVVEWPVDISKCDEDEPGIEFYCEARSLKSSVCPIEVVTAEEYLFSS